MSTEIYEDYANYDPYSEAVDAEPAEEEAIVESYELSGAFDAKVIGNTRLNLRESQSLDSPVIRVLLPHEKILGYCDEHLDSDWYQVATKTGNDVGYALRKFIVKDSEE